MRRLPAVPAKYRNFALPLSTLSVLLFLTFTLGRSVVGRILETRGNISQLKKEGAILAAKLDTLSTLNLDEITKTSQDTISAIPQESSTLFALASIRELTLARSLSLSNLRVQETSSLEKSGVQAVELNFETEGGFFQTLGFLNDLSVAAPLLRVSKVKFTVSASSALTKFTVLSAWGPLPKTIGKITEPLETLTDSEKEVLGQLANLRHLFRAPTEVSAPQGRSNPFAF